MVQAPVTRDPFEELASRLVTALDRKSANKAQHYGDFSSGYKHDVAGNPISVGYSHGPGGNFSYPGVEPDVFHTVVGNRGLLGQLPAMPSLYTNPLYSVITGVSADSGSEKSQVCDDAPVAGLIQTCMVTSVFGRYERQTAQIELNRLGQQNDRADPMDLTLVGSPLAESSVFTSGPGGGLAPGADLLRNETRRKFWELSTSLHRLMSLQLWTGNPVNSAAGGGYKELTGLDLLINSGYVDAISHAACASVNADVKNFNYLKVQDNGTALVNALSYLYHTRKDLAERTGVMPVRWVFAMRPEVFWEVSAVWPCAYLTYRCNMVGVTGANLMVTGDEQVRMRDDMRNGKYLMLDGDRIEVVLDDGIPMRTNTTSARVTSGCASSSIYLVPMSVIGGRAVTYLEYFQYNNQAIEDALGNMILGRIEGPWITVPKQRNWCVQWQTKVEPRVVLRTPWLAGRLDNVQVCPLQFPNEPFPSDPYYVGGGATSRPGPSYYSLWKG